MRMPRSRRAAPALLALAALPCPGQTTTNYSTPESQSGGGYYVVPAPPDPDSPAQRAYAAQQRRRLEAEKEMKKVRARHLGEMRNVEIRQAGIEKIRAYADQPWLYPSLVEVYGREKDDVRGAILDMLAAQQSDEADTTIAWVAVFHKEPGFRTLAMDRLSRRLARCGKATDRIRAVISNGLRPDNDSRTLATAALLANQFDLVEVIPLLINAQVSGPPTTQAVGGGGGGEHALAYILIGTQTSYIADLRPVVGDSAVAFEPTLGVVTDGVYLRVIDAVVYTYHTEVHRALVDLSSRAWGRSTDRLGWDNREWVRWYRSEFQPYWTRKQLEEARAAEQAATPPAPPGPLVPPPVTPPG
jgi:hypothetical protein